jgi:TfoX/Sxy family transcriptional regulator of competence genes
MPKAPTKKAGSKTPKKAAPTKRAMPKFAPAPEALKTRFAEIIAHYPEAELRKMFGYPAAFINDQMSLCTFGDALMMRLSGADRAEFLKMPNTKLFEPMPGRPMKEYVEVPKKLLGSDKELNKWLTKSLAYAAALPPKAKKAKKIKSTVQ